jgi:hypothetical protein
MCYCLHHHHELINYRGRDLLCEYEYYGERVKTRHSGPVRFGCSYHLLLALFPVHLGSAQHVLFLHSPLSLVISSLIAIPLISCLTQSIHLFLGRPLPLHPSTFMFIALLVHISYHVYLKVRLRRGRHTVTF